MLEACIKHNPEPLLTQTLFRISPVARSGLGCPVSIFLEQALEGLIQTCLLGRYGRNIRGAAFFTYLINDLVLQDGEDPCFQCRATGKLTTVFQRGHQCVLHDILSQRLVAQLKGCELQHVASNASQHFVIHDKALGSTHRFSSSHRSICGHAAP
ncbi:hypothetical protein SDC9_193262 [bioreactor metagenome]|uniref:Uncharacterized protein n=1 Tax=bioreactor metagenome TaxID=1076179 RepID=A0A645IE63_9ZZZZ